MVKYTRVIIEDLQTITLIVRLCLINISVYESLCIIVSLTPEVLCCYVIV